MTGQDLSLRQTCGSYPERYDVLDKAGHVVGDISLRWGDLEATATLADGTRRLVYDASPSGFGEFVDEAERVHYLALAKNAIALAVAQTAILPVSFTMKGAEIRNLLGIAAAKADEPLAAELMARREATDPGASVAITPTDLQNLLGLALATDESDASENR